MNPVTVYISLTLLVAGLNKPKPKPLATYGHNVTGRTQLYRLQGLPYSVTFQIDVLVYGQKLLKRQLSGYGSISLRTFK